MESSRTHDAGRVSLDLGNLDALDVEVRYAPYWSVLSVLWEVLSSQPRGLPPSLVRRVTDSVDADGFRATTPMTQPERNILPDCLFPDSANGSSLSDVLAELRETPAEVVVETIVREYGDPVPDEWRWPVRHPRQWMSDLADTVGVVARDIRDEWRHSQGPLSAEVDRVQLAAGADLHDVLLASLHPRLQLDGSVLSFADPTPEAARLDGRTLVLVPMLAGPQILGSTFAAPDRVVLAYAAPGLADHAFGARSQDGLVSLLGSTRANLLLALGRPRSMTEVAHSIQVSAPTVTFHCQRLVSSGLVAPRREGRRTVLHRTERGEELVDLMSARVGPTGR